MSVIHVSNVAGRRPTVNQLLLADSNLGYNRVDALFYGLKVEVGGTKSVVCLGESLTPGSAHLPVTINPTTPNGLTVNSGQVVTLGLASGTTIGALSSGDWNTFNNKVSFPGFGTSHSTAAYGDHGHDLSGYALTSHLHTGIYEPYNLNIQAHISSAHQTVINGTGFVKASGTSITFDANTYSLSSHTHTGVYEPANANIQSHISSSHQTVINGTGFVKASGTSITFDANTYALSGHSHAGVYDNYAKWIVGKTGSTEYDVLSGHKLKFTQTGSTTLQVTNEAGVTTVAIPAIAYPGDGVAVSTGSAWGTSLVNTTVGTNILTMANPGAVSWIRLNADNSVTLRGASGTCSDLGLVIGTDIAAYNHTHSGYALTGHNHTGVYEPANVNIQSHISSSHQTVINGTGFVKASGTTISFDANTYSLSGHNHSGTYEPANVNIQSHISSSHQTVINGTGFVTASGTSISFDSNTYALSGHTHSNMITGSGSSPYFASWSGTTSIEADTHFYRTTTSILGGSCYGMGISNTTAEDIFTGLQIQNVVASDKYSYLNLYKSNGTAALGWHTKLGRLQFCGRAATGSSGDRIGALIEVYATDSWTSSSNPTTMLFYATAIGSSTPVEIMQISGSGVELILSKNGQSVNGAIRYADDGHFYGYSNGWVRLDN